MRIAVCDDEKAERRKIIDILASLLEDFSVNEFDGGAELLESHRILPFDLILLDINMPEMNGIDTAAKLRLTDSATPVVFVSASDRFGVQSYRVRAFDYLLKPIDEKLMSECLDRLALLKKERLITVTYSGVETHLPVSGIQCLESNLRKTIFTLSDGKTIEVTGKLSDFEPILGGCGFCRCHKSYLVNLSYIDSFDGDTFHLAGGKSIKISRAYLQSAKRAYFDNSFATH